MSTYRENTAQQKQQQKKITTLKVKFPNKTKK